MVSRRPRRDFRLDSPGVIWDFLIPDELDVVSSLRDSLGHLAVHRPICVQQLSNVRDGSMTRGRNALVVHLPVRANRPPGSSRAGRTETWVSCPLADRPTRGGRPSCVRLLADRPLIPLTPIWVAKREQILDAALDEFARRGYDRTSMREIARQTGLSQAGLLHYFSTKEELFLAVLRRRDDRATGLLGDPDLFHERDRISQRQILGAFVDPRSADNRLSCSGGIPG